jgi:hypothetical protein
MEQGAGSQKSEVRSQRSAGTSLERGAKGKSIADFGLRIADLLIADL